MARKTGSSYEAIDSPIDRLDPIVKFTGVFCLGLSAVVFPSFVLGYLILLFLFVVAYMAKVFKKFAKFIIGFAVPIMVMLFFIQGFFSPKNTTIIADFGFAQLGLEGIIHMLKLVSVLLVFLGSFYLTTKTTDTGRMVAAFKRIGLKGSAGYLVLATLNVIPQMQRRIAIIQEAQNARGLETSGSLMQRFKAFIPLIGPVIMGSLVDVQERGMTIEARGFSIRNVEPTSFIEAVETPCDRRIKRGLQCFLVLVLIITILLKLNIL